MSTYKAMSAVIPPLALRNLLLRIEDLMRSNPRLKLPYNPRSEEIWKYYSVLRVVLVVIDKLY